MRDFLIKITDLDDKVIGELEVPGMGADNDFVDIISYAYHNITSVSTLLTALYPYI